MAWQKRGLIYCPDGSRDWARHSVMTPTPWQLDDETIRVYGGFRDDEGRSRIGYVDVDSANPAIVKRVSETPVLDIGVPGAFDDNGVILGDVIAVGDELRMYYVGFQLVARVKFLAFTGLAASDDGGTTFRRRHRRPVLDRTDTALYFRAIHSILELDGEFHAWCGAGSGWEYVDGSPYPAYEIWHTTSADGVTFSAEDSLVLEPRGDEYRIGRPRVRRADDGFEMHFTYDTRAKVYAAGFAESANGRDWVRDDSRFGIERSEHGWDGEMVCYPAVHETPSGERYVFYSGNGMGRTGVGYAEWKEEDRT